MKIHTHLINSVKACSAVPSVSENNTFTLFTKHFKLQHKDFFMESGTGSSIIVLLLLLLLLLLLFGALEIVISVFDGGLRFKVYEFRSLLLDFSFSFSISSSSILWFSIFIFILFSICVSAIVRAVRTSNRDGNPFMSFILANFFSTSCTPTMLLSHKLCE